MNGVDYDDMHNSDVSSAGVFHDEAHLSCTLFFALFHDCNEEVKIYLGWRRAIVINEK